jgi:CAAX prenyl protease-like protein
MASAGRELAANVFGLGKLGSGLWIAGRIAGSVITVPIAEELAFRGYLTRRLIAADFESIPPGSFAWPAFLISSVLFGALHGRWVAGTLAGLLFAVVYYRRGRIGEAVIAHAVANALIAVWVLARDEWSLWC